MDEMLLKKAGSGLVSRASADVCYRHPLTYNELVRGLPVSHPLTYATGIR
jgi:hypothetical protein